MRRPPIPPLCGGAFQALPNFQTNLGHHPHPASRPMTFGHFTSWTADDRGYYTGAWIHSRTSWSHFWDKSWKIQTYYRTLSVFVTLTAHSFGTNIHLLHMIHIIHDTYEHLIHTHKIVRHILGDKFGIIHKYICYI